MGVFNQIAEEFRWEGEGLILSQRRKSEIHYKAFSLDDLKFEVGDFVLIRNDDSVDPEDTSNCHVGQIKDLYDTGDEYEPHQAKVQWYSRISELPPFTQKFFDQYYECEVIEENRPHWSDIVDADTIFNKCVVNFLPVEADCKTFEEYLKEDETPSFFCRYKFSGYSLCPKVQNFRESLSQQSSSVRTSDDLKDTPPKRKSTRTLKKELYSATPTGTSDFPKVLLKRISDKILESQNARVIVARPGAETVDEVADSLRKTLSLHSEEEGETAEKRPIIHSLRPSLLGDELHSCKDSPAGNFASSSPPTPNKCHSNADIQKQNLRNTPQRRKASNIKENNARTRSLSRVRDGTPQKSATVKNSSGTPSPSKRARTIPRSIQFSDDQEMAVTRSGRKVKPVDYFAQMNTEDERKTALLASTVKKKSLSKFIRANYSEDSDSDSAYSASGSSSSDEEPVSDCSFTEEKHSRSSKGNSKNMPKTKTSARKCLEFSMPERKTPLKAAQNKLEESRLRLHVAAVPKSLPCREEEYCDIYNFVDGCLNAQTGGCMYISGVPGTGKTATVHEVIRNLEEKKKDGKAPLFTFVEVNGMWMTDPYQCYVHIFKSLTGKTIAAQQAANLLEKRFTETGPKKDAVVLLVDELDRLWTRKQTVMYNIFQWPSKKHSKLIVLAIANTMDLPERLMMNKISSRLGLTRKTFQPYNFKQLQEIIMSRIQELKVFDPDAVQFVARKVAAVSGDARRALAICRHATEIVERSQSSPSKKRRVPVGIEHVDEAIQQMFSSPVIGFIKCSSKMTKLFLQAMLNEFTRTGSEETNLLKVSTHIVTVCKFEGMRPPNSTEVSSICANLAASHLILVDSFHNGIHMKLRLSVSPDDVNYALTGKGTLH